MGSKGKCLIWLLICSVAVSCARPGPTTSPSPSSTNAWGGAPPGDAVRGRVLGPLGTEAAVVVAYSVGEDLTYAIELVDGHGEPKRMPLGPNIAMDAGAANEDAAALGLGSGAGRALQLLIVDSSSSTERVDLPAKPWSAEWQFWGGIAPDATDGFLLTRISSLVTVSNAGSVTEDVLPDGTITQYPTSDPSQILVGAAGNDNGPESRDPAATGLFLFNRTTGELTKDPVTKGRVVAVAPSSVGLAYLRVDQGAWFLLRADGTLVMATEPTEAPSWINSDGTLLAIEGTENKTACTDANKCFVYLVELASGRVLQKGPGPAASAVSFLEDSVVYTIGGGLTPLQIAAMDSKSVDLHSP